MGEEPDYPIESTNAESRLPTSGSLELPPASWIIEPTLPDSSDLPSWLEFSAPEALLGNVLDLPFKDEVGVTSELSGTVLAAQPQIGVDQGEDDVLDDETLDQTPSPRQSHSLLGSRETCDPSKGLVGGQELEADSSTNLQSADPPISNPDVDFFAKPPEDASFENVPAAFIKASLEHSSPSLISRDSEPPTFQGLDLKELSSTKDEQVLERLVSALADLEQEKDLEPPELAVPVGVSLERQPPLSRLMRPVVYGIEVPNTGAKPLFQVRVEHELPAGFRYLGADPAPEMRGSKLIWKLGDLGPKSVTRILVRVQPKHAGKLLPESATTFRTAYGVRTRITKPRLQVSVMGPESVARGDSVSFEIEVSNSGTDQAKNVIVHNQLSAGLCHEQGPLVGVVLGSLSPGESIHLSIQTIALESGPQINAVAVSGVDCTTAKSEASVLVTQPAIQIEMIGPPELPLNKETEYYLEASNFGTADAEALEGCYVVPEELELVSYDPLADFDASTRSITWSIERLRAGRSQRTPVRLLARFPGDFKHQVTLRSTGDLQASVEFSTSSDFNTAESSNLLEELLAGLSTHISTVQPKRTSKEARNGLETHADPEDQLVVFTLAGSDYAVPMANVLEIGRPTSITAVPNVPDWLLGVANFRGDIVSMVDLGAFLDLTPSTPTLTDGRLLIVRSVTQEIVTGLLVEKVKGLRSIAQHRINRPSSTFENRITPYLRGVTEVDGRLLVFLDLERLLLSAEMRQVEPV